MKKYFAVVLSIIMVLSIVACGSTTDTNSTNLNKEKNGEDYTTLVTDAFWEGTCGLFGINYSDFKMLDTATSYISDSTTSDGYTAYYYLVKTSYDTKNAFGQKINHQVTARCYYVPDYSELVYVTYITLDGEKILFDEEKEDWLLGIGDAPSSNTNTDSSNIKDTNSSTSNNADNKTESNANTQQTSHLSTEDMNEFLVQ